MQMNISVISAPRLTILGELYDDTPRLQFGTTVLQGSAIVCMVAVVHSLKILSLPGVKKVKKIVIKKIVRKIGAKDKQTSSSTISKKDSIDANADASEKEEANANASEKEEGEITTSSFEKDAISAHNLVSTGDTAGVANSVEVKVFGPNSPVERQVGSTLVYMGGRNNFCLVQCFSVDETAIQHYTKASELDDEDISYLINRAAVYIEMGKYDECIKDCDKAVERGRELRADFKMISRALTRKGTALVKLAKTSKDFDIAIETFQKALTEHRNPDTLKKLNEAERAKKELEQQEYYDPKLADQEREKGMYKFYNVISRTWW
jgi:tetratricopeptide (TPR) repeat protein